MEKGGKWEGGGQGERGRGEEERKGFGKWRVGFSYKKMDLRMSTARLVHHMHASVAALDPKTTKKREKRGKKLGLTGEGY